MHILDDLFGGIPAHIVGGIDGRKNNRVRCKHHLYSIGAKEKLKIVEGLKQEWII